MGARNIHRKPLLSGYWTALLATRTLLESWGGIEDNLAKLAVGQGVRVGIPGI